MNHESIVKKQQLENSLSEHERISAMIEALVDQAEELGLIANEPHRHDLLSDEWANIKFELLSAYGEACWAARE